MDKKHFEFSKIIVRRALIVFLFQMLLTMGIAYLRPESAMQLVSLMNATIPLYVVIFGGYFGKAGLENYNKIKFQAIETTEECEPLEPSNISDGEYEV